VNYSKFPGMYFVSRCRQSVLYKKHGSLSRESYLQRSLCWAQPKPKQASAAAATAASYPPSCLPRPQTAQRRHPPSLCLSRGHDRSGRQPVDNRAHYSRWPVLLRPVCCLGAISRRQRVDRSGAAALCSAGVAGGHGTRGVAAAAAATSFRGHGGGYTCRHLLKEVICAVYTCSE
jgi:hypothetical protein